MHGRSNDGKRCGAMCVKFKRIARLVICAAVGGNDRRFSNGHTIVEKSKRAAAFGYLDTRGTANPRWP